MRVTIIQCLVLLSVAALCYCAPRPKSSGRNKAAKTTRKPKIKCRSSSDCGRSMCCTVGKDPWTGSFCQPLHGLGESCFENTDPVNAVLSLPNGTAVELTDVYKIFCPCQEGLTCVLSGGRYHYQCVPAKVIDPDVEDNSESADSETSTEADGEHNNGTELIFSVVELVNISKPIGNVSDPICDDNDPFCNASEPFCDVSELICNSSDVICNSSDHFNNESEPITQYDVKTVIHIQSSPIGIESESAANDSEFKAEEVNNTVIQAVGKTIIMVDVETLFKDIEAITNMDNPTVVLVK